MGVSAMRWMGGREDVVGWKKLDRWFGDVEVSGKGLDGRVVVAGKLYVGGVVVGGRAVGGVGAGDKCWRPLTAAEYRWLTRARLGPERHPCGPGLRGGRDLGQTSILYKRD